MTVGCYLVLFWFSSIYDHFMYCITHACINNTSDLSIRLKYVTATDVAVWPESEFHTLSALTTGLRTSSEVTLIALCSVISCQIFSASWPALSRAPLSDPPPVLLQCQIYALSPLWTLFLSMLTTLTLFQFQITIPAKQKSRISSSGPTSATLKSIVPNLMC